MIRAAVICVIVKISVSPDDLAQLVDDSDKVYAEIFKTVPGFVYGSLALGREDREALAVVYFESIEAFRAAEPVIEGIREAAGISPGATFTLSEYDVIVSTPGIEPSRLFGSAAGTAAPGAPG